MKRRRFGTGEAVRSTASSPSSHRQRKKISLASFACERQIASATETPSNYSWSLAAASGGQHLHDLFPARSHVRRESNDFLFFSLFLSVFFFFFLSFFIISLLPTLVTATLSSSTGPSIVALASHAAD